MKKFNVYRPVGIHRWKNEKGEDVTGYRTIERVGTIAAESVKEAFAKARSINDPAPILEPI